MPKRKPSQRRKPEAAPQRPRDRLAEIRAEIRDVQQQIETKRRDGRVIRTELENFLARDLRHPHP
jgi:soluble cytochrome b562